MNPTYQLPPVLLGPESGRKVAEHLAHQFFECPKCQKISARQFGDVCDDCLNESHPAIPPDPRDEAVGMLRDIGFILDEGNEVRPGWATHIRISRLLARIDK